MSESNTNASLYERLLRATIERQQAEQAELLARTAPVSAPEDAAPAVTGRMGPVLREAAVRGAANAVDLVNMVPSPANMVRRAVGMAPEPRALTGGRIRTAAADAGLTGTPEGQPDTAAQRYAAAATEGAVSALPTALLGPGGAFARLLGATASGAGGGVGGEGAAELAAGTRWGQSPEAQDIARLAGGIVGGMAAPGAVNAVTRAVPGQGSEVAGAYRRLGITPRVVSEMTDSPFVAQTTSALARMPGGGRIEDASRRVVDDFARAVDDTSVRLADPAALSARTAPLSPADLAARAERLTPQAAGGALQASAQNWIGNFRAESDRLWTDFWSQIPSNVRARLPETRRMLSNSDSALARDMPELAKALEDPAIREFAGIMSNNPQAISGQALRDFRSLIGERIANAPLVGDANVAGYKRLYSALTRDLEGFASQAGGARAVEAFQRANAHTREGHKLLDDVVGNLIGQGERRVSPEEAYRWATTQARIGDTRLSGVREAVGEPTFNTLAGTALREAAQPPAGMASVAAGGPAASPAALNKFLNSLSPEARLLLFSGARNRGGNAVDDLGVASGRMVQAERFANRSGTAGADANMRLLSGAGLSGMAALGLYSGASPEAAAAPIAGLIAAGAASRGLTNPMLAAYAARRGMTQTPGLLGGAIGGATQLQDEERLRRLEGVAAGLLN